MRVYFLFFIVSFLLNFFWESWHAVYLYGPLSTNFGEYMLTLPSCVQLITYASLMDALLLISILIAGAVIWKHKDWWQSLDRNKYIFFIATAVVIAAIIEYKAVYIFHQWSYSQLMPTVFGLGLSPLLQLAVTGLVTRLLLRESAKHS